MKVYGLSKTERNRILRENYIKEIFDSQPLDINLIFQESYGDIYCIFKDMYNNDIKVDFIKYDDSKYEMMFTLNGNSSENFDINYSLKDYTTLLTTLSVVLDNFLKKYNPEKIYLEGEDSNFKKEENKKHINQKQRIYNYLASKIDKPEYNIEKNKKFMKLIKK